LTEIRQCHFKVTENNQEYIIQPKQINPMALKAPQCSFSAGKPGLAFIAAIIKSNVSDLDFS
jgi:hypothetical protein